MGLGRRESRHDTALSRVHAAGETDYSLGDKVMTPDGPGTVDGLDQGGFQGDENYNVTLHGGMGGGTYSSGQLSRHSSVEAAGIHLASDDYPELTQVLQERPDIAIPTRLGSKTASGPNFTFQHREVDTGGSKYPTRVDLTAHHPETGAEVGKLQYFPPKRKNGPLSVDNVSTSHPGAGSALMNEMESRHPDASKTVHIHEQGRGKNTPSSSAGAHGNPTDWDQHYPTLGDTIHRGMTMRLPQWDARTVNSSASDAKEHVQILHDAMRNSGPAGMHWSTSHQNAENFAHNGVSDHRTDVPVILHAKTPDRKSIETRPQHLFRNGVFPYDHGVEKEVPVKKGQQVHVTGMSWKPDAPHPDADEKGWLHHNFDEPIQRTAFQRVAGDYSMMHQAPGPGEGNNHFGEMGHAGEHIPVYRAAPHGVHDINPGDWVSTSHEYAHQHAANDNDPENDWPVLTAHVPAEHLWTDHNDENEQGYQGPPLKGVNFHHEDLGGEVTHHDARALEDEHKEQGVHLLSPKPAPEVHTGAAVHLSPEDHAFVHNPSHPITHRADRLYKAVRGSNAHLFNDDHEDPDDASMDSDVDAMDHPKDPHPPTHVVLHGREGNGGLHHGISWAPGAKTENDYDPSYPGDYTHHNIVDGHHYTAAAMNGMDGGFEDVSEAQPEEEIVHTAGFDGYGLFTLASQDKEFKFHFTAAWADVQRKAKRIRSEGGVRVTLASDGVVFGEVKGDHHVYETGVQRLPGSRNSIATYSCGCKWGAYHWGAQDDFSRFAGRMCSHALALQYEAQSRGMFGRDVTPDQKKPEWVPKRVVLRYDIDEGSNKLVRSSAKEAGYDPYGEWDGHDDDDPDNQAHAKQWDDIHSGLGDIHRGISVHLRPEDHEIVHNPNIPDHERAQHLLKALPHSSLSHGQTGLGTHWSDQDHVAEDFGEMDSGTNSKGWHPTSVVFHAHPPAREDIDEHPDQSKGDIYGYHDHGEREVPIKPGGGVHLKGISWKNMDEPHEDFTTVHGDGLFDHMGEYQHHDYGQEGYHHYAVLEVTPIVAVANWALRQGDDADELSFLMASLGLDATAAVNSPWGEPQAERPNYTPGPTKPPNKSENPASTGWAVQGDPDNWDRITPNELGDRVAAVYASATPADDFLFEAAIPQEIAQSEDPLASTPGTESTPGEGTPVMAMQGPERPSGPKGGTGGRMPPGHPQMPQHEDDSIEKQAFWPIVLRMLAPAVIKGITNKMTAPKGGEGGGEAADVRSDEQKRLNAEGLEASLHMEPEGALPFTDGDAPDLTDDESLTPPRAASLSTQDVVAQFQARAAHLAPSGAPGAALAPLSGRGDASEIAAAARAVLAKTAVKDYSPAEQAAIINEGHNVRASNLDRLDIGDTHYAALSDEDDSVWP